MAKKQVKSKSTKSKQKLNSNFESKTKINKTANFNKIIYLIPRVVSIIFILFISFILVISSFAEPGSIWLKLMGFIIHLIPSFILLAGLIIAWKNEKIGSYIFLGLCIVMTLFFHTYKKLGTFLIMSLPILIISGLFYLHYKLKN